MQRETDGAPPPLEVVATSAKGAGSNAGDGLNVVCSPQTHQRISYANGQVYEGEVGRGQRKHGRGSLKW